jgi:ABC-2 type transport system permease protein
MRQLYQQMGRPIPQMDDPYEALERLLRFEKYEVRRLELAAQASLPGEANTIVVINPHNLSARHHWELSRALHEGKSLLLAVQQYRWNYNVVRQSVTIAKEDQKPEVNPWLSHYGLEIDPAILMDINHQSLTIRDADNPLSALTGGGVTLNLPLHIMIPQDNMNRQVSITSRLSPLFYLWGNALRLQADVLTQKQLTSTVLFYTSPRSWTVPAETQLASAHLQPPAQGQQRPLAVLVRGQFADVFAGKERPAWPQTPPTPGMPPSPPPPDDAPVAELKPAVGKLLLVGNAQMFHRNFLAGGNLDFFLNSVDALTLGDDIIQVRGKKQLDRSMSKPSTATRNFWKFVTVWLVNLLIAFLGIGTMFMRRRARAAYTMAQSA